jgi:hypothetical protein
MYSISKYRRSRYWGVYKNGELVTVTVYRRGARAVVEALTGKTSKKQRSTSAAGQSA